MWPDYPRRKKTQGMGDSDTDDMASEENLKERVERLLTITAHPIHVRYAEYPRCP
jgi:hypothetical protein